jgi:hypothetical protein
MVAGLGLLLLLLLLLLVPSLVTITLEGKVVGISLEMVVLRRIGVDIKDSVVGLERVLLKRWRLALTRGDSVWDGLVMFNSLGVICSSDVAWTFGEAVVVGRENS